MKNALYFSALLLSIISVQQTVAQNHHYKFDYALKADGTIAIGTYGDYAREYTITYSGNGFYFSDPYGSSLSGAFVFGYCSDYNKTIYNTNNVFSYVGNAQLSNKPCKEYSNTGSVYCYVSGIGSQTSSVVFRVLITDDGSLMLIRHTDSYVMVYSRITNRSVPYHTSISPSPEYSNGAQPSNNGGNYNNGGNNQQQNNTCVSCHGDGKCSSCAGRGQKQNMYNHQYYDCTICRGSGKCQHCYGLGWR